jgi:hypothetical protein
VTGWPRSTRVVSCLPWSALVGVMSISVLQLRITTTRQARVIGPALARLRGVELAGGRPVVKGREEISRGPLFSAVRQVSCVNETQRSAYLWIEGRSRPGAVCARSDTRRCGLSSFRFADPPFRFGSLPQA